MKFKDYLDLASRFFFREPKLGAGEMAQCFKASTVLKERPVQFSALLLDGSQALTHLGPALLPVIRELTTFKDFLVFYIC